MLFIVMSADNKELCAGEQHRLQRRVMVSEKGSLIEDVSHIFCRIRHLDRQPPSNLYRSTSRKLQRRVIRASLCRTDDEDQMQLRDIWADELRKSKLRNKANGKLEAKAQTIDVLSWLGRATLDIIGLAGKSATKCYCDCDVEY